jgi:LysM repeat protein
MMENERIVESQLKFSDFNTLGCFEKAINEAQIDEGIAKALAIGSLLFIPFFANAEDIKNSLPKGQTTYTKADIKDAMEKSYKIDASYGGVRASNLCNMIAATLWMEARGESHEGREAVLSVIYNRCGNDLNKVVEVLKKPKAFSCWNGYKGGWTDSTYKFFAPSSIRTSTSNEKIWRECNEMASKFLVGDFKSTIGNFNSYMNKQTADKENVESWGRKCKLKIGKHHFGYLPENDGFKINAREKRMASKTPTMTVVIKKGDSLSSIANKNNVTVDYILRMNPNIKDKNKLRLGQKIKL